MGREAAVQGHKEKGTEALPAVGMQAGEPGGETMAEKQMCMGLERLVAPACR